MKLIILTLLLTILVNADIVSPANPDLGCDQRALLPSSKWNERFGPVALFDGFFKAKGTILANISPDSDGYVPYPVFNLEGIWRQYNDAGGVKWGEFYITIPNVATFFAANVSINAIRSTNYVCQINYPPSPADKSATYSQLEVTNPLKTNTVYLTKDDVNHAQATAEEYFHWANDTNSAINGLTDFVLGPIGTHKISTFTYIKFDKISETEARELGWTGSNPPIPSSKRRAVTIGSKLGMVPIEFLSAEAREILGY